MRVNVVCRNHHKDRVLPRFARYLSQYNGWDLSRLASTEHDLNYYIAYIEHQKNLDFTGPLAAYFTHYEPGKKADLYDVVAQKVQLRVAMNQGQFKHLRTFGPTIVPTLPVELDNFTLRGNKVRNRPVVGFSGYTYGSGRKGENLAKKLCDEFDSRVDFRASGRGWPCSTKGYSWRDLPRFFKNLDVFVCPSRIEGGPMTTLEALATGVPVVIPAEVGIHPQLPYMAGIYRYVAGNSNSLAVALEQALDELGTIDREALRAAVEPYSIDAFCRETQLAFEEHFVKSTLTIPEKSLETSSGIYLVAFGAPARRCAIKCIKASKRVMPSVPIALCSTTPLKAGEDVFIKQSDKDIGGRTAKLAAYNLAPKEWEYILYLDADTEPMEDLRFLFEILAKGWEVVICKDMSKYQVARFMAREDNKPETKATIDLIGTDEVLQYNGGVFGFRRCERTERFFALWNKEWQRWAARDQGALLRALYTLPLRVFVLGNQWNASDRYPAPAGRVAVWHHNIAARRWVGKIEGRLDGDIAWDRVKRWETAHGGKSPKDIL